MNSLLYPAFQKFYSALKHLDDFNTDKNLFDNISSLDAFFSEFRNITFVLQKSLKHTEFIDRYEVNRRKHLGDLKWFVDKRNETIKEQPFELTKRIEITIYSPEKTEFETSMIFTALNEVETKDIIESMKDKFNENDIPEIFFSAHFSFFEEGDNIELWDLVIPAINKMDAFLTSLSKDVVDTSKEYDKIKKAVYKLTPHVISKSVYLIDDYVYYPRLDSFDRADRFVVFMGNQSLAIPRMPLEVFDSGVFSQLGTSYFDKFVTLHTIQQNINILPTIMTIFVDHTFELDTFHSSIKTTFYRKINEVAKRILKGEVKEVFHMATYVGTSFAERKAYMTTLERAEFKEYELLSFMKVDSELNEEEYIILDTCLMDIDCVKKTLSEGSNKRLTFGKNNFKPITEAFKKFNEAYC